MKASKEIYTLEEILALRNEELTSNWSRLASLIRAFEKVNWEIARKKATELIREKTAIDYIEAIRANPENKPESIEPIKVIPKEVPIIKKVSYINKDLYEKNYDRLLKIAPELEQRLLESKTSKHNYVIGKSRQSGYMDFNLKLLHSDKDSFYLAISHYYKQNGDMIADPDMEIRVDVERRKIEALAFQNSIYYATVYDNSYKRTLVNLKEKKSQNEFLTQWLKNLKNQGHKIVWQEDETELETGSKLIVEYGKKTEKKELPAQKSEKTTEPEKPEESKESEVIEKIEENQMKDIPTKKEPMKEEQEKKIEQIVVEKDKLILLISDIEKDIDQKEAELKADELLESRKVTDYVIKAYSKQQNLRMNELFESNYYKLLFVIPNLLKILEDKEKIVLQPAKSGLFPNYEIIKGSDLVKGVPQITFYEKQLKGARKGTLMIAFDSKLKKAWMILRSEKFHSQDDYFYQKSDPISEEKYQVNKKLETWLFFLIRKGFHIETEEIKPDIKTEQVAEQAIEQPIEQAIEKTNQQVREDWLDPYKENAKKIPHFEVGQVKLTEAHIRAGLVQRDINWINKHRQGMVLIPKKTMTSNTISKMMDKAHHAEKPGFRISKTGQLYYEGRSNRSDLRNKGL